MAGHADRVKETTTTTGTGSVTLAGAVSQFRAFSDAFAVNDYVYYTIAGQSGTEWEVGRGQLTGSTTLARQDVLSSSNAGALVNFSAGTKDVFCTVSGQRINDFDTTGKVVAKARGNAMP